MVHKHFKEIQLHGMCNILWVICTQPTIFHNRNFKVSWPYKDCWFFFCFLTTIAWIQLISVLSSNIIVPLFCMYCCGNPLLKPWAVAHTFLSLIDFDTACAHYRFQLGHDTKRHVNWILLRCVIIKVLNFSGLAVVIMP